MMMMKSVEKAKAGSDRKVPQHTELHSLLHVGLLIRGSFGAPVLTSFHHRKLNEIHHHQTRLCLKVGHSKRLALLKAFATCVNFRKVTFGLGSKIVCVCVQN